MKKRSKAARPQKRSAAALEDELKLKIEPRGPDQKRIDQVARALADHPSVQEFLAKTRNRMLSFELVEPEVESKPARPLPPPNLYRATFYDYTNNRTILVDGDLDQPRRVKVSESGIQPLPSYQEFEEAVKLLMQDPNLGPAIREKQVQPYPPMPPIIDVESAHGRMERTVGVGLLPVKQGARHEIVGVNMVRRAAVRFAERDP
ncbi:MAG TPA: hypothetical protein VLN44_10795, partial [Pyrinomonadaceae bacterium]|nr:hypothetical protein [Pyrinomonadaceae bacterium]